MKILVFDVPAISGGALSILTEFYKEVYEHESKDIEWIFILSEPRLKESKNVKILNYPWVKKSWFHRLYFDKIYSRNIIANLKPDKIFSLQNTVVANGKGQILYVHQALPFSEYRIKLTDNIKLWIYQNIIGKLIFKSIRKADKVIVQTNWFKKACIEKTGVHGNKIKVVEPLNKNKVVSSGIQRTHRFFFPASFHFYKNHKVIFEAAEILKKNTNEKFEIILTIDEEEVKSNRKMHKNFKKNQLPITFLGTISHSEVLNLFHKTILIFPSFIETFGLPLVEAKERNAIILVADEPYSNEILKYYNNSYFFDKFDSAKLADYMYEILKGTIIPYSNTHTVSQKNKTTLVDEIINL